MSARPGYLLAEALCALALGAVLAAAAGSSLASGRRALATAESRARARRAALEAVQVSEALLRDADSLVLFGDTAVEFDLPIALGVACARQGAALTLAPAAERGTQLLGAQPIEVDDVVRAFVRDSLTGVPGWTMSFVDSVASRNGGDACAADGRFLSPLDVAMPRPRLVLAALDPRVGAGTPVRVARRGRLALYPAGGGDWMLGWRRCAHGACGVVQPVAGPLRTPSAGGFRVRAAGAGWLLLSARAPGLPDSVTALVIRTDAGR